MINAKSNSLSKVLCSKKMKFSTPEIFKTILRTRKSTEKQSKKIN